jgi:hypothetical protein
LRLRVASAVRQASALSFTSRPRRGKLQGPRSRKAVVRQSQLPVLMRCQTTSVVQNPMRKDETSMTMSSVIAEALPAVRT